MNEKYGKIAYEAYCKSREWKSVRGEPLPHWEQQDKTLQKAWIEAAKAVREEVRNQTCMG